MSNNLKGKAIIQLFEGDKEVYKQEHDNIITNAYRNLINPNFPLDLNVDPSNSLSLKTMTPMFEKMFGGVLVSSLTDVDANADNIMITKEHYYNHVGNAGGVFAGNSIFRGSYNEIESGWDAANQQWKQVWDFPTNACNGKIGTIFLVNRWLGDNGLLKDPNDSTITTLVNGYGSDLANSVLRDRQAYNSHNFLMNKISELGYYLYSKSNTVNVYVKRVGNSYVFREVTKRLNLKINDTLVTGNAYLTDGENMFEFGEEKVLEFDALPQDVRFIQYEAGTIYAVSTTIQTGTSVTFKVYKINPDDYTLKSQEEHIFYISTNKNTSYAIYFNNRIYLTFAGDYVNLYICDLKDGTFINREINFGNYTPICCRFYDTIMIQRMAIRTEDNNPIYILDSKDNLCKHNIKLYNVLYDDDELYIFNKIFTNDEYYNYPIANASQLIKDYEVQNQIILPHMCSINKVTPFVKYNSQTMKITYIIKDN